MCVSSSVNTSQLRWLCRMLLSQEDNSIRFRETRPSIRMAVWVTVKQPSKRWRNKSVQRCFECTRITTATATSFLRSFRFFPRWLHMLRGRSHGMRSKLVVKGHFQLMSKDYHGEVAKFSELVWYRIPAKQPKQAEQRKEAHWVGKSERSDEHLLAITGSSYSSRAIRRKQRDEQTT